MSLRPALFLLGDMAGTAGCWLIVSLVYDFGLHWDKWTHLEGRLPEALLFGVFVVLLPKVFRRITGIFRSS